MAKILEYALLSQESYGFEKSEGDSDHFFNFYMRSSWNDHSSFIPYSPIKASPFYAQFWVKKDGSEAVIVIRGTDDLDNVLVDIKSWYPDVVFNNHTDNCPQRYFRLASAYYQKCIDYLRVNYPKTRLSLTGHSLGGALAQLIIALPQRPHPVIAFNSPGIGYMAPKAETVSPLIHNINSRYGFINKVGKVFGSVDYVDVPEKEDEARNYFESKRDEEIEKKILTINPGNLNFKNQMISDRITNDEKIEDISLALSLYPQHAISNLVTALRDEKYTTLANRPYFGTAI